MLEPSDGFSRGQRIRGAFKPYPKASSSRRDGAKHRIPSAGDPRPGAGKARQKLFDWQPTRKNAYSIIALNTASSASP